MLDRHLDDLRELRIALVLEADIAGIDAVFVERLGAAGMIGEQLVADVMEVADERHADADLGEPLLDVRHGGRRLVAVDRDAHQLGAGARQRRHLARGAFDVGGVGIGHRLHDDRRTAADDDAADIDGDRFMTFLRMLMLSPASECQTYNMRSTRPVHQHQAAGHQRHRGGESRRQRLAQHQMAGGDAE